MAEQKTEKKTKNRKAGKKASVQGGKKDFSVNKLFAVLNIVALLLIAYQAFALLSSYSQKSEELFEQGRVVSINPVDNSVRLKTISVAEIESRKRDWNDARKNAPKPEDKKEAKIEEASEMVGPPAAQKVSVERREVTEGVYGPMPAGKAEDKAKAEVKKAAAPLGPVDYNKANLSVLVVGVGLKQADLDITKDLPKEVSFAISPYADELQKKIDYVAREGRQVLLNLMMQSAGFPAKDSGPLSIQAKYDEATINTKLALTLDSATAYIGVITNDDEMVVRKFEKLSPVLRKMSERGLFFGYYKNTSNANVENDAKPLAADIFGVDYMIEGDTAQIKKQLDAVKEDILLNKKRIVIAVNPYPNSIIAVKEWLDENRGENIRLAPISYFVTNN